MSDRIAVSAWGIRHALGPISLLTRNAEGRMERIKVTEGRPEVTLPEVPGHIRSTFGVRAMEIPDWYLDEASAADREGFEAALRAEGVVLRNVTVDGRCVGDGVEAYRQDDLRDIERVLALSADLGAEAARVNLLPPPIVPGGTAASREEIVEGLKRLVDCAGRHGLRLLIENHCEFTNTREKIERLLEAVPGLGLILDTGNIDALHGAILESFKTRSIPRDVADAEPAYRFVEEVLPLASLVHVKTYGFHPDGRSMLYDLDRVVGILADSRYQGPITIECASFVPENVYPAITRTVEILRDRLPAEPVPA